ncbi:MAG TPA: SurA N-terminal domain-containing protein [Casimicrobiaceae bacterium]|nr:SurA N-terminal domain-containing protein [Casimicrobiaceae bacterium]
MFDIVTKHKRIAQLILVLLTIPFAFFGVDFYFRQARGPQDAVATVGRNKVTQADFDELLRDQQNRMRESMGRNYDPSMFDNPEVRYALLNQLINQRLLENVANKDRFRVSDAQLYDFIAQLPPFQEDGKFSPEKYRQILAAQGQSTLMFEQRVRAELALSPLQEPIIGANVTAKAAGQRYLSLLEQQREVATSTIDADPLAKDVKIDDAQIKKYYDENQASLQTPEQAKVEYVLLTQDALAAQVKVDPAEVKQAYDANAKQYTSAEERRASHILIAVKPDASQADKDAARKKAEGLLAQVKANPDKFPELAKANSQDPGSAAQGGDLGSFARGAMVKSFEDAVFSAKEGDIVGPVQTDFGYHIIKVTGITPSHVQPFETVKAQIEGDLKRQKASQKFAAAADQLQNLVYEQADSLAPAAKALDLKVETTPLVSRAQVQALAMGNPKFVQALFSPESVQSKRNTEAMEVAPNTLMAGRIVEYHAPAPRPLAEVTDEIRRQLTRRAASEQARKIGEEKLAALEQGKDAGLAFGKPQTLTRNQVAPGFTVDALNSIFRLSPAKVPAYTGAVNDRGGYTIYKLSKVVDPPAPDASKLNTATSNISDQLGRELMNAYLASLKSNADVKIMQENLEKK